MLRDVFVVLFISVFLIFSLEIGARFFLPNEESSELSRRQIFFINSNERDNNFDIEPDENLGYRLKNSESDATTFHDSWGRTYLRSKPNNVFRIICLGGSTTFGSGVGFSDWTYPSLLEEIFKFSLANCTKRVEVINAGMLGYHSWHSRIRAEKELNDLSPDVYLVMDGLNDIASINGVTDIKSLLKERELLTRLVTSKDAHSNLLTKISQFLSRLALYRVAQELLQKIHGDVDLTKKLEAFGYRANMIALIDGAKAKGVDTVLVNYPWSVQNKESTSVNLQKIPKTWGLTRETVELFKFGRKSISRINSAIAADKIATMVDLQPLMDVMTSRDGYYSLYIDSVHFTKRGNFIIARELFQYLTGTRRFKDFIGNCSLPSLYEIDSVPYLHELATWGGGFRGEICKTDHGLDLPLKKNNITEGNDTVQGMSNLVVADKSVQKGIIEVKVVGVNVGGLLFFPRICGINDQINMTGIWPDGRRSLLFSLKKEYDDGRWFPFCTRYALPSSIDQGISSIEIELIGAAQIFVQGQSIFFQ